MSEKVSVLIGDGHEKGLSRCSEEAKRAGRPRKSGKRATNFTNGWFMVMTPKGRIVSVVQQKQPESNHIVICCLTEGIEICACVQLFLL